MEAPALGPPKFDLNQSCFVAYDDHKFYQGKVVKREVRDHAESGIKCWCYLVHYMGWNKKFDEWVEEFDLKSSNPSGTAPSRQPQKRPVAVPIASKPAPGALPDSRAQMAIAIPAPLKKQLVDDHDAIKNRNVVPLPKRPCVNDILQAYVKEAVRAKAGPADDEQQVANGLRSYFDRSLALVLLFGEERTQADDLLAEGNLASSIYGGEHLLRLFVKLPDILPVDSLMEEQYRKLQDKLHDVLAFLKDNQQAFFLPQSQYKALPPAIM